MKTVKMSRCSRHADCTRCGNRSGRHSKRTRTVTDIGQLIELNYTMHLCRGCKHCFVNPAVHNIVAPSRSHTRRFIDRAVYILNNSGETVEGATGIVLKDLGHSIAPSTLHDWASDCGGYKWENG